MTLKPELVSAAAALSSKKKRSKAAAEPLTLKGKVTATVQLVKETTVVLSDEHGRLLFARTSYFVLVP